ncbi:hypothetical protein Tco_1556433 [Tanacetum coccineum]
MSIGAEMNHKEPGFELEDSKMGRNGLLAFVRLDFELRGFKAWILFLVSALGTHWDLLDQRFAAIDGYRRRCVGVIGGAMDEYVRLEAKWKDVEVPCGAAAGMVQKRERCGQFSSQMMSIEAL